MTPRKDENVFHLINLLEDLISNLKMKVVVSVSGGLSGHLQVFLRRVPGRKGAACESLFRIDRLCGRREFAGPKDGALCL